MSKENKPDALVAKKKKMDKLVPQTGWVTKSNYFDFINCNLEDYDEIELTPKEARQLSMHMRKMSTGASAMVPLVCVGPNCPFRERCPLQKMEKAPLFKPCILETTLMKEYIIRFFEEYDVDPNNFTEVGMVNELAELEVLETRLNMVLARAENAELVTDQVVSIGQDGTPIIQKQISPFMEQKQRLQNRRSKIVKLMVGDRQEKYKKEAALKVKIETDPSSRMAKMRGQLDKLQRKLDNLEEDEGEILTPEDVIDDDNELLE